jgi:hypothetical protein
MVRVSLIKTLATSLVNVIKRSKLLYVTAYHVYNVNPIEFKRSGVSILDVQLVPHVKTNHFLKKICAPYEPS